MRSIRLLAPLVTFTAFATLSGALLGCGSGVAAIARENRTFYEYDVSRPDSTGAFEVPYPRLDAALAPPRVPYRGVSVLFEHVHLSRPVSWVIRAASNEPGKRFVQYVSPRAYLFSVYEWTGLPDVPWRALIQSYEEACDAAHAEIVERRIPTATWNAQGREFVVRRKVPAAQGPLVNTSHEYLLRTERRVVLVQIVSQGGSLEPVSEDLTRVMETLELD